MFDPWEDFKRFGEMMNRMFDEFRITSRRRLLPSSGRDEIIPGEVRQPFIDNLDAEKELIAAVELPGFEKRDININLTEDRLEITAETRHEENKEEEGYLYRERQSGKYYRSISLPSPADSNNARAPYKNGVLEIKMPDEEIKEKKTVQIDWKMLTEKSFKKGFFRMCERSKVTTE